MVTLNEHFPSGENLNKIYNSSDEAKATFDRLGMRERIRSSTDIQRFKNDLINKGVKIEEHRFMKTWKDLEAEKVGAIVYGRNGLPTRFMWHYSLKEIATAAKTGVVEEQLKDAPKEDLEASPRPRQKRKYTRRIKPETGTKKERTVYIPLRENFIIEINIPSDVVLNEGDINSVTNALKRIA